MNTDTQRGGLRGLAAALAIVLMVAIGVTGEGARTVRRVNTADVIAANVEG